MGNCLSSQIREGGNVILWYLDGGISETGVVSVEKGVVMCTNSL